MHKFTMPAAVAAMFLLTGCVSTKATMLGQAGATAAISPEAVVIYRTADQVKSPYAEVALLNSTGDYAMTDEAKMMASMRKRAAKLGANGIILDGMSEPGTGMKVASVLLGVAANRRGQAVAIRLEDGATAAP